MKFSGKRAFYLSICLPIVYFVFYLPISYIKKDLSTKGDLVMAINRDSVKEKDRWNIEKMYSSLDEWRKNLKIVNESNYWKSLDLYKNKLHESTKNLKSTLTSYFNLNRSLENLAVYAHLLLDEDLSNDKAKEAYGLAQFSLFKFTEQASWIEPEILQLSSQSLEEYINNPDLKDYKFYLEKLSKFKPHTLSIPEELIIARVEQTFQSPYKTFSALDNADLIFEDVLDSSGNKHGLTHGKYTSYLREPDRILRKNAFETYHKKFMQFENTLCEVLQGQIKNHEFVAKTRKFNSCLDAALYPNQISTEVYHNLIKAVRDNIKTLHKFVSFKKRILKLDKLSPYDMYAPLITGVDFKMNLEKAKETVVNSVAPLGKEYQDILKKGIFEDRWVDYFETNKKRSGAYSSGCYDSMPYILMNYYETLNDVTTLAHEAGHSMHSYLSNHTQSYQYSQYPIFVAEVASTFNEQLLHDHLLKKINDKKQEAYLLADSLDRIQATFFRQTLFAEFELKIHDLVEKGTPLTPSLLKNIYHQLYLDYYGPDMEVGDLIDIEWGRVPHFYYNFYVYQYATGISAAIYLYNLLKNDKNVCQQYLEFLKSGGSHYPLELLKKAGVDLTKPDAVQSLIYYFDHLIDQLSKILEK
jgi:oligoendopeptidase F